MSMEFSQTPLFNSLQVGIEQNNSKSYNNLNQSIINNNSNGNIVHESLFINNGDQHQIPAVSVMSQTTSTINNSPNIDTLHSDTSNHHGDNQESNSNITNQDLSTLGHQGHELTATDGVPSLESNLFSTSLSCDELLHLYTNTRVNFLEAEERFKLNGHLSAEIYQELDNVQKQLNYKSNHLYYLLLNRSRNNSDFRTKLKQKVIKKLDLPTVKKIKPSQIATDESGSEIEVIGDGISTKVNFSGSRNKQSINEKVSQSHQEETTIHSETAKLSEEQSKQIASQQTKSVQGLETNASNKQTANNVTSKTSDFSEPTKAALLTDVSQYLEKVAKLRGKSAAKAEAERLQNRYEPLKRLEPAKGTEEEFKSVVEKLNQKNYTRPDAVDFFKRKLLDLKHVDNQKSVSRIITSTVLGFSKDIYGGPTDVRYVITNELINLFPKGSPLLLYLSQSTKFVLRIANWLRRELKMRKDLNVGYCMNLLGRLNLSTEQLNTHSLFDILTFLQKKDKKWSAKAESILKAAEGKDYNFNDFPSATAPQGASKFVTATQTSVKSQTPGSSSFKPQVQAVGPKVQPLNSKSPLPSQASNAASGTGSPDNQSSHPKQLSNIEPSNPTKSVGVSSVNSTSNTFASAASKKKWSFNSYMQSTKKNPSISDESSAAQTESRNSNTESNVSFGFGEHNIRGILRTRSFSSTTKKSVRFSNNLVQVKEFISSVGHIGSSDREHKRAREMESSEAQTLKKQKTDYKKQKFRSKVEKTTLKEWKLPYPIDLKSLPGFNNGDDIAATRGGTIPVILWKDNNVPKTSNSIEMGSFSPFEPNGLIIDESVDDYTPAEISKDGESNTSSFTEDECHTIFEYKHSFSRCGAGNSYILPQIEATPVAATHGNAKFDDPANSPTESNKTENKNVDEDVLALLEDDDDMLSTHHYDDEKDFHETDQSRPENLGVEYPIREYCQ